MSVTDVLLDKQVPLHVISSLAIVALIEETERKHELKKKYVYKSADELM